MRSKKVHAAIMALLVFSVTSSLSSAVPIGYQKTTVPLGSSAAGVAYAPPGSPYAGTLFVFESTGSNSSVIRVINPDLTFGTDLPVTGIDATNLFLGGMTYDTVTDQLLVTDNTFGVGAIYSLDPADPTPTGQTTIATGIANIADIAVRSTGEILVSTAVGGAAGEILEVDRGAGTTSSALAGLDYGAGIAFDAAGDLIVLQADDPTFAGDLQRLPITKPGASLVYGAAVPLLSGMASSFDVAIDSEGDLFTTGFGGLFEVTGGPLTETSFNTDDPFHFSTAISFFPGSNPFEPGETDGGLLAYQTNFDEDFLTIITPGFDAPSNAGVPEPASFILLLLGSISILQARRPRRLK